LEQTMPFGVAMLFLLFGFFVALNSSAMFSGVLIGTAQKKARQAGTWAKQRATNWAATRWAESERVGGTVRRGATALSRAETPHPEWGQGQTSVGSWFRRRAADVVGATATPLWAGARATGQAIGPGHVDAQKGKIAQVEKELDSAGVDTVYNRLLSADDWPTRIAALNVLAKKPGFWDDAVERGLDSNRHVIPALERARE